MTDDASVIDEPAMTDPRRVAPKLSEHSGLLVDQDEVHRIARDAATSGHRTKGTAQPRPLHEVLGETRTRLSRERAEAVRHELVAPTDLPPEPPWESPDSDTSDWFDKAVELAGERCVGFDPVQASRGRHLWTRTPVRLLSPSCWLMEVRYPLGPAVRLARFLVDLESHGTRIESLNDMSTVFHEWADRAPSIRTGSSANVTGIDSIGAYARVFCRGIGGAEGPFLPLESPNELTSRWLGDPPTWALALVRTWVRLTPSDGVTCASGKLHLVHGSMVYGSMLYEATIGLRIREHGHGPAIVVNMIDDHEVQPEEASASGRLPIVPSLRDPLTHAYFPLKAKA